MVEARSTSNGVAGRAARRRPPADPIVRPLRRSGHVYVCDVCGCAMILRSPEAARCPTCGSNAWRDDQQRNGRAA